MQSSLEIVYIKTYMVGNSATCSIVSPKCILVVKTRSYIQSQEKVGSSMPRQDNVCLATGEYLSNRIIFEPLASHFNGENELVFKVKTGNVLLSVPKITLRSSHSNQQSGAH